jgi:hypothetical protein
LNVELDALLTFETLEKNSSKEVISEDGSTRDSGRVSVYFYIDVSKANHSRAMGDEMASIYVGPKRKKFLVHKKLICEASDFFSKAFTGGFQESQGDSMHLPDDDPNAFALFIDWIYRSKIPTMKPEDQATAYRVAITLYNLYIFAGKLCLDDLANATMDEIQKLVDSYWYPFGLDQHSALISKVYTETPSDSPLRKFCSHIMAFDLCTEKKSPKDELLPIDNTGLEKAWNVCKDHVDLFRDFWSHMLTIECEPLDPFYTEVYPRCYFHKHRDGSDRENCKW